MSEYTDIKNNTYRVKQVLFRAEDTNERREEILEDLYKIFESKR